MRSMNIEQTDPYKPLRDIVFETLREAILDGRLVPGERVMEIQVAEKLGVSRTPVREAIRKLELEGLLIMIPRKGAYVADVSLDDVMDVLEIRASLEGLAASLGAQRRVDEDIKLLEAKIEELSQCIDDKDTKGMVKNDAEFHKILMRSAKNEKLTSIVEGLKDQVQRFRVIYFNEHEEMGQKLIKEHREILESIKCGDKKGAMEAAQEHIFNIRNHLVNKLEN
ncbi:MAG: GntR family transcriptional regulator [Andreesenia angusta]|nr:GntR family transcriptional regulator [Andreesenia angusta]